MLLKELTNLNGVSGNEGEVREFIKEKITPMVDKIEIDSMGNLIAYKKGISSKYKVMLSSHMDEVGFIVTEFLDAGTIKFKTVGSIDERILPGKRVLIGENKINGVIGAKPIHLQEQEERNNIIKLKNMYIDIGADTKEEAKKLVKLGDYIAFYSEYNQFGQNAVKAKALDDRAGCSILIEMLKDKYQFDLYALFSVQEEVGLRGSEIATRRIMPDLAIVVEGTTCVDVPNVKEQEHCTTLEGGAALSIMDRTSYSDKSLVNYIYNLAFKNNIKIQYKRTNTGGNDAGKIQLTGSGVKVAAISVPCRYIHSPFSIMSLNDYNSVINTLKLIFKEFDKNQNIIKMEA